MKKETPNIGIEVKAPEKQCNDEHCPFHGSLSVHGRMFTGNVVSDKMSKSVSVVWENTIYVPKYERYEKQKSKVKAHNPECLSVKTGDRVKIMQCRPISKTKHFVVIEKVV